VKWFIDGVWRQRVGREVALLRKLGRHPLRDSVRALFDRWQAIKGRPRQADIRHGQPPRLQVPTHQENDDVHA
jgi:hypothetical protein